MGRAVRRKPDPLHGIASIQNNQQGDGIMTSTTTILGGLTLVATAAMFASQGASEAVKSPPEYFVTAEGDNAHLWVREGTSLRVVGHGTCKDCPLDADHDHKEGDGHDHPEPGAKK